MPGGGIAISQPSAHRAFRVAGAFWDCLPFGWNLAPCVAQATLVDILHRFFVREGLLLFLGVHLLFRVYLDDVLLLSPDPMFLGPVTTSLVSHIVGLGLIVSTKSRPLPSQSLVWLGKLFDLRAGSLEISTSSLNHTLGVCFLACLGTLTVKRLDALMGYLLWVFRPQRGCTLFLRSWYERRRMPDRFKGAPSPCMCRALLDCLAISFGEWAARPPGPPPLLVPLFSMDTAASPMALGRW